MALVEYLGVPPRVNPPHGLARLMLRANFLTELALSVNLMKKVDVSDATKE